MANDPHCLDARFVDVSSSEPLTVDPENLDCLIDVFCLADGSRKFVVLTHGGQPILLTEEVALASRRIRQQLAVHDMVSDQAPRRLDIDELHLMVIGHAEQAMDLQGPNDPVHLRGRISGPWLSSDAAVLCEAQLMVMRADLLQALSQGFLDQFLTPSAGSSGARVWNNLWLPGADESIIRKGRGCVLAYPHNALAGFLETGNDLATRTIAEKLLQDFQRDLQKDNIPGRLRAETLPVASLRNHREELEANGIVVKGDTVVASLPENTGWLKRVYHHAFPKMEALPAEGDVGMFCSLAAVAICDLGDWPNARSRALTQRLTRYRAMWTAQLQSHLQPVRNPRDGNFEISGGVLEAKAGVNPSSKCLYFDIDDGFAGTIDNAVELEFEYRDDKGPPIVVSYNGESDPYTQAERVPRGGTGKWLTSSLSLMNVDFQNAQNSGADFRIEFGNSAGAVRSVVLKASPRATPTSTTPKTPQPKKQPQPAKPSPVNTKKKPEAKPVVREDGDVSTLDELICGIRNNGLVCGGNHQAFLETAANPNWHGEGSVAVVHGLVYHASAESLQRFDSVTGRSARFGGSEWHGDEHLAAIGGQLYLARGDQVFCVDAIDGSYQPLRRKLPGICAGLTAGLGRLFGICDGYLVEINCGRGDAERIGGKRWKGMRHVTYWRQNLFAVKGDRLVAVEIGNARYRTMFNDGFSEATALVGGARHLFCLVGQTMLQINPKSKSQRILADDFDGACLACIPERQLLFPPTPLDQLFEAKPEGISAEKWDCVRTLQTISRPDEAEQLLQDMRDWQDASSLIAACHAVVRRWPIRSEAYEICAQAALDLLGDPDYSLRWWMRLALLESTRHEFADRVGDLFSGHLRAPEDALRWFAESMRRNPNSSHGYRASGHVYRGHYRDPRKAQQMFEKGIEVGPHEWWGYADMGAVLYHDLQRPNSALQWYEKAVKRAPNESFPLDRIAEIHRDHYKDYYTAARYFEQGTEAQPANCWPCQRLAELCRDRLDDRAGAIRWFQSAFHRQPDAGDAFSIAELYMEIDQPCEARGWYERAVKLNPNHREARNRLEGACGVYAQPTALACEFSPKTARPGRTIRITYNWIGCPTEDRFHAFVHIEREPLQMAFQDDHEPEPRTTEWSGDISYTRKVRVPDTIEPGRYRMMVGLYDQIRYQKPNAAVPPEILAGPGVEYGDEGDRRCCVGVLVVV